MEERALVETGNSTVNNGVNLFAFTNIDRAWKFASLLSESAIIPDTFRKNPASCLIALDMANRMHRNPMEVMQAMLSYRAASFFSRAYCPDLTGGFHSSDELSDSQDDFKTEVSSMLDKITPTQPEVMEISSENSLEALKEELLA